MSCVLDLQAIDAIIFDLGGVIINIRYASTIEALGQLCNLSVESLYTQHNQVGLFDAYEMGCLTSGEFRQGLRQLLCVSCSDQEIDDAWNAMLLDIPRRRLDLLAALGQRKRIFLLSNTNEIHKLAFDQIFAESVGMTLGTISDLFEKAYYSHLMGDRKPNPSIFQTVLTENGLNASRTLFIDDTARHIEGAQSVGLKTCHLTQDQSLETLFQML
ncbi:MAG: HAD family phosphatase [Synechococcales bacterium]|nr:HAD family phosphatase [Synechococcales bacterium]